MKANEKDAELVFKPEVHAYPTLGYKLKTQGCVFERLHANADAYFSRKVSPDPDDIQFLQNIEEYSFKPKIHECPPRKPIKAPLTVEIKFGETKQVIEL